MKPRNTLRTYVLKSEGFALHFFHFFFPLFQSK